MTDVARAALDDLVARFASATLPKAEWTHAAHLSVGAWHVSRFGPEEALARLRAGIRRLNDAHGTPNTPGSGYHETITRAYVLLLDAFLAACPPSLGLEGRVAVLLAGPDGARDVLFAFYSRERLLSSLARSRWVDPDLGPIRPRGGHGNPVRAGGAR